MSAHLPLLRAADFQTAWYYSLVVFTIAGVTVWAAAQTVRAVPAMWRAQQRGLAVLVASVTTVTMVLFTSMLLTTAITLLQGPPR
ncbi:MAG TPA: hypothetical protein VGL20_03235 [Candidatus Dormibacteraeota bacterium]